MLSCVLDRDLKQRIEWPSLRKLFVSLHFSFKVALTSGFYFLYIKKKGTGAVEKEGIG